MEELGRMLKEAREKQGLSLDDIHQATKIHRRHLEAIEAGAFHLLPGPAYARAFLRHYARAVGLDPQYVVDQYRERQALLGLEAAGSPFSSSAPFVRQRDRWKPRRRERARRARLLFVFLVVALLTAGAFYVLWPWIAARLQGRGLDLWPFGPPASAPQQSSVAPSPGGLPKDETARDEGLELLPAVAEDEDGGSQAPPSGEVSPQQPASGSFGRLPAPDGSAPFAELESLAEADSVLPGSEGLAPAQEPASAAAPSDEGPPGLDRDGLLGPEPAEDGRDVLAGVQGEEPAAEVLALAPAVPALQALDEEAAEQELLDLVALEVDVREACWFDVFADGARIFMGTLEPGTRTTWVAREVLVVRFGRPEGVFLTLNGTPLGRAGTGVITREFRREVTH